MRVLVIGAGGREHALAWKIAQSRRVQKVFVAPGNGGTAQEFENVPLPAGDIPAFADFADAQGIDLTVVGPEVPLVAGVSDEFDRRGLPLVGPSRSAAQLEGSKVFAKEFMERHAIPTARYRIVRSYAEGETELYGGWEYPLVVKADGLAAGKGVFICSSLSEARAALDSIFLQRKFGPAGDRVILEEFLQGRETSYMVFTDGRSVVPIVPSQDYKRVRDGDQGPNTGGMGAVSVPGLISESMEQTILGKIVHPTLAAMEKEGNPFRGILYAGLMLAPQGPRVLEYNVRLGDPETQVVLLRLESDFALLLESLTAQTLQSVAVRWSPRSAACVVLAAQGYPEACETGRSISGLAKPSEINDIKVFHAGTRLHDGQLRTAGGRVLTVAATGAALEEALERVYRTVQSIHFEGMHYRSDIGKGLTRI